MASFPCGEKLARYAQLLGWKVIVANSNSKRPYRISFPGLTGKEARKAWQKLVDDVSSLQFNEPTLNYWGSFEWDFNPVRKFHIPS